MNIYLKSIVNQLKSHSATLQMTSMLIDKPWALIDDELEIQKMIFKKNKELVLSKNGQVQIGKWDYFPEAKSLLIDRNTDIILCNEAFIDEGVMVLKLDGTNNQFFILANENIIPDLNAKQYLKNLRYQKLCIVEVNLADGTILEVQRRPEQFYEIEIGNLVSVDSEPIEDGKYRLFQENMFIEIQKGCVFKILMEKSYINPEGQEIIIQQQIYGDILNGDYVFMYGKPVMNAIMNFSRNKKLIVRDGMVVRLERKNAITRWLSKMNKKIFDYYYE